MSESKIILPGVNPVQVPVDPTDPTKGTLTPVATAADLTAGVMEAMRRTENLAAAVLAARDEYATGLYEAGTLIEYLAVLVVAYSDPFDGEGLAQADTEDEALEALRSFLEQRKQARAEMEAEQQEATPDVPESDKGVK